MRGHPSRAILDERVAQLPSVLAAAAATPFPGDEARWRAFLASSRFVLTGGGLSEGPARVLCALLRRAGRDARFVPQAALAGDPLAPGLGHELAGASLILFSQGLAPNARLPLPWLGPVFSRGLLVTSVRPGAPDAPGTDGIARRLADAGHLVWTLPPEHEDGLLLRVLGPAVAVLSALRFTEAIAPHLARGIDTALASVGPGLERPGADLFGPSGGSSGGTSVGSSGGSAGRRPIVIVADPELVDLAMPLRWKLLEGLRVADPPVWEPLQVAHGPLQSIYDERVTVLVLRGRSDTVTDDLFARLRATLRASGDDPQHRWVELRASTPGPAGLLELDALLDAALLTTLAMHPLALDDWPSRGQDGALYDVGKA